MFAKLQYTVANLFYIHAIVRKALPCDVGLPIVVSAQIPWHVRLLQNNNWTAQRLTVWYSCHSPKLFPPSVTTEYIIHVQDARQDAYTIQHIATASTQNLLNEDLKLGKRFFFTRKRRYITIVLIRICFNDRSFVGRRTYHTRANSVHS